MATIVVMDDDLAIAELIRTIAEAEGHTVYVADNVPSTWGLLGKRPDLLFLDIDLPNETGIDLVMRMRSVPEYAEMPVVFVSAYPDRAWPLQATGRGAISIIEKPFAMNDITSLLRGMFGVKGAA